MLLTGHKIPSDKPQNDYVYAPELPWDAAVLACMEYIDWRECHIEKKPWNKIDNLALCESVRGRVQEWGDLFVEQLGHVAVTIKQMELGPSLFGS